MPFGASAAGWSPGSDDGRPERENMENLNIENLYQLKDVIKEQGDTDGDYLAFCESGNTYDCEYSGKFKAMFFAIPESEKILGYGKIIARH